MKTMRILKDWDVEFAPRQLRAYKKSSDVIEVMEADVQALLDAGVAEHAEAEVADDGERATARSRRRA